MQDRDHVSVVVVGAVGFEERGSVVGEGSDHRNGELDEEVVVHEVLEGDIEAQAVLNTAGPGAVRTEL